MFLKLLVLSDPHGAKWRALDLVNRTKPDLVIIPGDIPSSIDYPVLFYSFLTGGGRRGYVRQVYQRFLNRLTFRQIRTAKRILTQLTETDVPVLLLHGNTETPETRGWLHLYCHRSPNFHWLPESTFVHEGIQFVGHGWVDLDPAFDRIATPGEVESERAKRALNRMLLKMKKKHIDQNILIAHAPPFGTDIDFLPHKGYNAGSKVVKDAMGSGKFSIVISGHLHESWGLHYSNEGWWGINAGAVIEDRACLVDTEKEDVTWIKNVVTKLDLSYMLYKNRVRVKFDKTKSKG